MLGVWTYRSFLNDPNLSTPYDKYLFGSGITIAEAPMGVFNPYAVRSQGVGIIGRKWIYNYNGYVIPPWPNGVNQVPAIVGSIVGDIPHQACAPGTTAPASVTASWIAVWKSALPSS